MREVVGDGLCFGFWVVLVVYLVGLLVADWFGALLGFAAVFFVWLWWLPCCFVCWISSFSLEVVFVVVFQI